MLLIHSPPFTPWSLNHQKAVFPVPTFKTNQYLFPDDNDGCAIDTRVVSGGADAGREPQQVWITGTLQLSSNVAGILYRSVYSPAVIGVVLEVWDMAVTILARFPLPVVVNVVPTKPPVVVH